MEPRQAGGEATANDPFTPIEVGDSEELMALPERQDTVIAYSCGTPLNIFNGLPSES
jgi:hypothetical protein